MTNMKFNCGKIYFKKFAENPQEHYIPNSIFHSEEYNSRYGGEIDGRGFRKDGTSFRTSICHYTEGFASGNSNGDGSGDSYGYYIRYN